MDIKESNKLIAEFMAIDKEYMITKQLKHKTMSIEESNGMIAQFIGWEKVPADFYVITYIYPDKKEDECYHNTEMRFMFHEDWNQLMFAIRQVLLYLRSNGIGCKQIIDALATVDRRIIHGEIVRVVKLYN